MDLRFTPEEIAFRDEVRSFFRDHLPDDIREKLVDGEHIAKDDMVRWTHILNEKGWAVPHWPEEYGGTGWDPMRQYIFLEELQKTPAPSPLPFGVNMVGPVIYTFGNEAQKKHFLPRIGWPDLPWQRLHPRAWRRLFVVPSLITLVVAAQGWWFWGWDRLALLVLLLLPFWAARAVVLARRARYAVTDEVVATRWGWLEVTWRFAEIGKLQAVQLTRSPFDRRHGMATLWLDTAGASQIEGGLRIPYLPEAEARRIKAELEKRLAHSRLRW